MNDKERAAMQQALECLNTLISHHTVCYLAISESGAVDAESTLREALAEQALSKITSDEYCKGLGEELHKLAEQAEQEPVGYLCEASFGRGQVFWFNKPADNTPLYAAPVRTKDLTDDEIVEALGYDKSYRLKRWVLDDARAVITADREKNKCQH